MLTNDQTYFKYLAVWTPQDFQIIIVLYKTLWMKELTSFLNGLGVLQQIETYDIKDEFLSQSDCAFTQRKIHRKLGRPHLNRVWCCFGGKNEYGFWIWFTKPISEDPMLILKQQYWLNCIFLKVNSQIDVLICLLLSLYLPS